MSDNANTDRKIIPVEQCWREPGCPCEHCVTTQWRLDIQRVKAREAERQVEGQAAEAPRSAAPPPAA